jgi:filamentous hemagglutinin family protein
MKRLNVWLICAWVLWASGSVNADGSHPAGIALDGTVGSAGAVSLEGPHYEIRSEYGSQAGGNLFHSFGQFNLHAGETADFTGPDSIQNIISRVTGGEASWINGVLRSAIPQADLYFFNPQGILFGPHAFLDVPGSFHAGAADYLRMSDGTVFSAVDPADPVLSAASPHAFGFLDADIGSISVQGRGEITEQAYLDNPSGLHVCPGKQVTLTGGSVDITQGTFFNVLSFDSEGNPVYQMEWTWDDALGWIQVPILDADGNPIQQTEAVFPGEIRAADGSIRLTAVSDAGETPVYENPDDDIRSILRGPVALSGLARLDTSGDAGGAVFINGGAVSIDSAILYSAKGDMGKGGGTTIRADDVSLSNGGQIRMEAQGAGEGGDIEVRSGAVSITGGAYMMNTAYSAGDGGDIRIHADEQILISSDELGTPGSIASLTRGAESGAGNGGDVFLQSGNVILENGGSISASSYGPGNGGNIHITAEDTLHVSGEDANGWASGIFSQTVDAGTGGIIEINAKTVVMEAGAAIDATSAGMGQGGKVRMDIREGLSMSGQTQTGETTKISSNAQGTGEYAGNGGRVEISAQTLEMKNGAQIVSASFGPGEGGSLEIAITREASVTGADVSGNFPSGLYVNSTGTSAPAGNGGNINFSAGNLILSAGGQIAATSNGPGRAGNIYISVRESSAFIGFAFSGWPSGVFSNAQGESEDAGDGGAIFLETGSLYLDNGGAAAASTYGSGQGGNLEIRARDTVQISGVEGDMSMPGGIVAQSGGLMNNAGNGGRIELTARSLTIKEDGKISTSSAGPGQAGDIRLNAEEMVISGNGSVSSGSESFENGGDAGTLHMEASGTVSVMENGSVSTAANGGGGGKIDVHSGVIYLNGGEITSSVRQGIGNGGDILTVATHTVLNHARIAANAEEGDGGAVFIKGDYFFRSLDSQVTATSRRGNDGTVKVEAPELDMTSGLIALPGSYLDAGQWTGKSCAAGAGQEASRFVIDGRDGVGMVLDDWIPASSEWLEQHEDD